MATVSLRLSALKTPEVGRLRAFYEALGVELAEEKHGSGPLHYAGQAGDATLEVYQPPEAAALPEAGTRLDAECLELVVVDVDGSPALYELPEFKGKVQGAGETAWGRHQGGGTGACRRWRLRPPCPSGQSRVDRP